MVIACGVWSPRSRGWPARSIPLTPAVHQMIDVGPVPRFAGAKRHIEYPIVRDMDTFMYERQDGVGLEIGSYAHRPILHDPEEIPSIEEAALSPTELPFTQADFDQQMEHALELMPEIVGDESGGREVRDQRPAVADARRHAGAGRDARGAQPVVVRGGVGQGGPRHRQVGGRVDDARRVRDRPALLRHRPLLGAPEDARPRPRPRGRGLQQDLRHRPPGRAVGIQPRRAPGAVPRPPGRARGRVLRGRRLGAAAVVRVERAARRGVRRPHQPARGRVGRALVVADHQRRAPGDARRRRHGRPDRVHDLRHRRPRRARRRCRRWPCARWTSPSAGSSTRRCSRPAAGSRPTSRSCASATSSSASSPAAPTGRPTASGSPTACPQDGSAQLDRHHLGLDDARPVGAAGARHPCARSPATTSPTTGFRFGTCRTIEMDTLRVLASRISYVGDLGWELYVPIEQGRRLWDMVFEEGRRARHRPGRHRRLRHHRPAREVLPRLRVRARERVQRRRGRHGLGRR